MKKKKLLISLVTLALTQTSVMAYDLKTNMLVLNAELSAIQQGFIASNKEGIEDAIKRFAKDAQELLGNKKRITAMLPEAKKHKANEALIAAQIISTNAQIIMHEIENKENHSEKERRENAQRAYTYIEHACFRCHNIVRDASR